MGRTYKRERGQGGRARNAKQIREAVTYTDTGAKDRAEVVKSTDALTAALMAAHGERYAEPVPDTSISVPKRFHRQDVPMPQSSMGLV